MQRTGMRVMYWPNEPAHLYPDFTQAGGRDAFGSMEADGTVDALQIYSYRVERARFSTAADFERSAMDAVRAFAPDILFVQHLFGTDLGKGFWQAIRHEMPGTTLVYHEGDPFDRGAKRIDRATVAILGHAHLVLACGLGSLADILGQHSTAPIGWMPHCFVRSRFAQRDPATAEKTHDLVMIGNSGRRRRLKMLYVPGGRRRAELARHLSAMFASRFALYGGGWTGLASAQGSLPFFKQEEAIQSGRITVNWDHFDDIDYYFSDRLPISLAAGVPHVTTHHFGYDHIFADCPGLYACKTPEEAVETARWLIGRSDNDLLAEGLAAKRWVFEHLEAEPVFRNGLEQAVRAHRRAHTA
ncbi:hypothetical protein [Sphingomonas sp. R86520]|uniref:hypothetical protein n=1 Tax=Sphingomonas sp. R86520 TaxID=3093859 RepID=UPI0036D36C9B